MIGVLMKQKNMIEQLRFAYDFLITVFIFPTNGRGPSFRLLISEFGKSSLQIDAYCKTFYLKFLNELYFNDNNNKLYLQDSHRVLQYCQSYFVLITNFWFVN